MLCKKCGYLLGANDTYCINCGEPVENKEENIESVNNEEENSLEVLNLSDSFNEEPLESTTLNNTKFENSVEEDNLFDLDKPLKEKDLNKEESFDVNENNIEESSLDNKESDEIESLDLNEKFDVKENNNKPNNSFLMGLLIGLLLMVIAVALTYVLTRKLVNTSDDKKENKVVTENSDYKINYLGNIVKIPEEYSYEVKNNELLIYAEDNNWTSETGLLVADFDKLKNNFAQIKNNVMTLGFTIGNIEVKKINNEENIVMEIMSQMGVKFLCSYTKYDDKTVFYTVLASKDNTYDYNALEEFSHIISNVEKTNKVATINPSLNNVYMSSFILMP